MFPRDKISKLFYIDFLFDIPIKKSDFNIYLFQILIFNSDKDKDNFIKYKLNY